MQILFFPTIKSSLFIYRSHIGTFIKEPISHVSPLMSTTNPALSVVYEEDIPSTSKSYIKYGHFRASASLLQNIIIDRINDNFYKLKHKIQNKCITCDISSGEFLLRPCYNTKQQLFNEIPYTDIKHFKTNNYEEYTRFSDSKTENIKINRRPPKTIYADARHVNDTLSDQFNDIILLKEVYAINKP
ncbi:hypothetical protein CDIK_0157 [Cucumispora dikerogammari]|nr:hypothetical protein CDIK_0157 [Cucumispora dikerogammari]